MVCITKEGKILNVKKVLATLLCLTMTTTVLPTAVYAETGENAESYDIYVAVQRQSLMPRLKRRKRRLESAMIKEL